MNFQDGNRPTSSESKCNIEEFNGELRGNDEDIHEQQEIIIVKEEWIEDSCSSWTEESILPESSAGDSSQQMEINNELSGPSYEKEGGINYSGEDSLETDVSSQNLVCTHCNFKTFDSLDFETHIRQHVQVLFNNKMQEGVADRLNQSGETSSGQQFEESNDNSNLIVAEYTESFRTDGEAVLKKKKRIRPKPPRKEILFTCGYCDFKCPKTDTMKDHLKVVHAGKSAAAEKNLETSRPKLLLLKPEKEPLVCELCGFKCMKQSGMLVHNRSHTGERPFSCSYCEQKFMQKSHMVKHLKCHKGKITLNCKECAFVCSDPLVLSQHTQQEHKRVKTLQCCHLCEYKFLTASQLQRHLRTHSGERPFQCTVCDYRASQMDTLKAHFRTHSGEKPYSCALCAFRCTQLSALKTHQSTHTNEKPFACEMCAYRCARLSNLRRHMQRHAPKT